MSDIPNVKKYEFGYIYLRSHVSYIKSNIIKVGMTTDLVNRDCVYATGEEYRGKYEYIYKFKCEILKIVDNHIKKYFKHLNHYKGGSTELFKTDIINELEEFFNLHSYEYIKFSVEDIERLYKEIEDKIKQDINENIDEEVDDDKLKPHAHQQEILDNIEYFYKNNNIGKICWACGLGKALLSILIVKQLKCKLVVIGVPSIHLQKQMKNEILKIFKNTENIIYVGSESDDNNKVDYIYNFIHKKSKECKFIVTTYTSSYKLSNNYIFDLKIGDEAHHLVGTSNDITKSSFHNIKSDKTLFMTATEKIIQIKRNTNTYSMDDESIFGKLIDSKTINWAIENKKITDYNLIILKNTDVEINDIVNNLNLKNNIIPSDINSIMHHKDLFLSAFMALKSMEKYNNLTHILIYTNTTKNAELIKYYIDIIINLNIINLDLKKIYNKALHSGNNNQLNDKKLKNNNIQKGEISKFINSDYGIISSVYIFGEGFDCPRLNGVIFSDNMNSDIRIVQSALRPNRKDINYPNKIAYIIIPYVENVYNLKDDNINYNSFEKCKTIISKIRNVDEDVQYKIKVISFTSSIDGISENKVNNTHSPYIIDNDVELNKIKLKLIYSKILNSNYSEEQNEYNYMKQLNIELQIQSKEEYSKQYVKDYYLKNNIEYVGDPESYFKKKCVWVNWYDFLGIDTSKFIKTKEEWIEFCKPFNIKNINDYAELCNIYKELPLNPAEIYLKFSNIINELQIIKKRR